MWHNKPTLDTPIDAQALEGYDDALLRLLGVAPAVDTVGVWTPGGANGALVYQKITNTQIDPAAAISRSKLDFGGGLVDADIAAGANIAFSKINGASVIPAGISVYFAGITVPTGWLWEDGSSQLRATYASLFAALTLSKGTFTVTLASPGVFTNTAHGLVVGDAVYFTTTGSLPTGLTPNLTYYVSVVVDANNFQVSTTRGGASVNTSVSQSGVHTLVQAPHGVADSTHFYLPDSRGRVTVGYAGTGGHADMIVRGRPEGGAGTTLANRRQKHTHAHNFTLPNHVHSFTDPSYLVRTGSIGTGGAYPASSDRTGGFVDPAAILNTSGSVGNPTSNPTIPGTIGTATDTSDEPSNLVAVKIIKT